MVHYGYWCIMGTGASWVADRIHYLFLYYFPLYEYINILHHRRFSYNVILNTKTLRNVVQEAKSLTLN